MIITKKTMLDGINIEWTTSTLRIEGETEAETTYFNKKFPTDSVVEFIDYLVENDLTVDDVAVQENCLTVTNPDDPDAPAYTFETDTDAASAHELVDYFFFVRKSDEEAGDYDEDDEDDYETPDGRMNLVAKLLEEAVEKAHRQWSRQAVRKQRAERKRDDDKSDDDKSDDDKSDA